MSVTTYDLSISGRVPDDFVTLFAHKVEAETSLEPPEKRRKLNNKKARFDIQKATALAPQYLTPARSILRITFTSPPYCQLTGSEHSSLDNVTSIPITTRITKGYDPMSNRVPRNFHIHTENHSVVFDNVDVSWDQHSGVNVGSQLSSIYRLNTKTPVVCSQSTLRKSTDDNLTFVIETRVLWRNSAIIPERIPNNVSAALLAYFRTQLPPPTDCQVNSNTKTWFASDFYGSVHVPEKSSDSPPVKGLDLIQSRMFPFQRRAVRWLLEREGVDILPDGKLQPRENPQPGIPLTFSRVTDADGRTCFISLVFRVILTDISAWRYNDRSLKGGILAEEMGLGKTVEMLALICSHRRFVNNSNGIVSNASTGLLESGATLIITPPAILEQWKQEIEKHAPSLNFMHYQGINHSKLKDKALVRELASHDIVLTTYNVLQREVHYAQDPPDRSLRRERKIPRKKSPLVQISWWRVSIDEAQMIESGVSNAARVALIIPRCNAWAMSGTPLRKDMKDLYGLLSFLRYEPFCYSMDIWVRLYESFKQDFKSIIGRLVLRHNKDMVRDELHLPQQKRVVITIPFTAVEEQHYGQLFEQMCDVCGLDTSGNPCDHDWDPSSKRIVERMRSWLIRLRQACLHPEVKGRRKPFGGQGPLRSVADVLGAMIDQNYTEIRGEERARLLSQIRRGQLMENALRPQESLRIWQDALSHSQSIVEDCRAEMANELKRRGERQSGDVDEEEEEDDDNKDELEAEHNRLGTCRQRLRAALEIEHMCEFFIASARYQIKSNTELTEPDSEEFRNLENLEEQGYETAKLIRREMLAEANQKVNRYIERLRTKLKRDGLVQIPKLSSNTEVVGIESRRYMDWLEDFYDAMEEHTKKFNEWLNHMVELLLKSLVDEEDEAELKGDEYESSTKHQDEMYVYMEALRVMFAQHHDAITGQVNTLIVHEVRLALERAELDEGPAPKLYISLMNICKNLRPPRKLGSLRGLVNELRNLVISLERQEIQGSSRARAELAIVNDQLHNVGRVLSTQSKIIPALEKEIDRFRTVMNQRLDYYRQLQQISDTVAPYNEETKGQPLDQDAFDLRLWNEAQIDTKMSVLKSKRRYLLHLRDESGAEEHTKTCVICQSPFEIGILTVCGHKYCKECLRFWWRQHRTCPICKNRLGPKDFHEITYKPQELVAQEEKSPHSQPGRAVGNPIYSDISSGVLKQIRNIDIDGSFGTKIDTLARHLLWLRQHDPGAKSIVFSQYKPFLGILASAFTRFKIGFTSIDARDGIELFKKDPSKECFLLHAKAHSSGLNLVNATHVFLCEPLINTALELQAIARVHRIGQHRETTIWMYLVADTVEESIYEISVHRRLAHIAQRNRERAMKRESLTLPLRTDTNKSTVSNNYNNGDGDEDLDLQELPENVIDAANSLEMEDVTLGKLLSGPAEEGERVDDDDLWRCLFGKSRKSMASLNAVVETDEAAAESVQNDVSRLLRAEAAESRQNGV